MGQDYNETSDMLRALDVSMPTATSSNAAKLPEFKIQFHPRSNQPLIYQSYEEFRVRSEKSPSPVDKTPWSPFRTLGDFEFAEIALASLLNQQQVNALLNLFARVTQGAVQVTLKNDAELRKVCDAAAMELTPFSRVEVKVPYKKEECTFEAHIRPLWEWALDILENPFLGLHFTWDAQRLYRHDGVEYEHFYDEPWTGDYWWDIQSSLPDIKNAMLFGLILYADKSNLSSFGTAKSYPVVVCCANLLVEIRNSNVIGGGTVVGWLPIVPEDAEEEGKLGYTTLKCVIWHESFKKLLLEIEQYSKTGYVHTSSHDNITRWLSLSLMMLSADFEEISMMALTRGRGGKHPCPVCLVLSELLHDLSRTFEPRTHAQGIDVLCVYDRSNFDRLHYGHGFWGKHVFGDLKVIVKALGRQIETNVEKYVASFPRWQNLAHFNQVIHVTFSDGNKLADISKDYTKCVVKSNIDGLRTDWNFLKVHLWKHIVRDICLKGAARNYSTRPNESMHKPIRDAYEHRSNGRDVPAQVLRVDHQVLATKLLRLRVDHLKKSVSGESDPEVDAVSEHTSVDHIKLGAHVVVTQTLKDLEENGQPDMAFHWFRQRFCEFLNDALPAYGYQVKSWISLPADFTVKEYRYLLVNYESTVTWNQCTDRLRCNPSFFGVPRYDCALIQYTETETAFVRLICMFSCVIPDIGNMEFILAQPFTTRIGPAHTIDRDLRLKRVKTVPRAASIFIPLCLIIRGAVLAPDTEHDDEFFVVEQLDSDMFLRTQAM
ncbi:hypothetical protein M404DRAFT_32556 [Pisolithus tinctorius Marx 270]|uniref:Uncharacterized protein n=1 Tax=Pisolithus tinctorius Marx 270 TaxID=870435 RepID=A0A0C3N844_PISTI|nr:hypothetical protein M404DRAFT_32556 [Pisolithus tinctorius Marx 270]